MQEGIQADDEALSVMAQAGEGSVRDSLSALDQAIACCGDTLRAAEVRALLGAFSLDALERVSQALVDGSPARMLEVVDELERNGHNRSISPGSCRAISATCSWPRSRRRHAADRGVRGRAAEDGADCRAVLRRRSDALSAAGARFVPRLAVLAAAALSSGDRFAAHGAGRAAGVDRGGISGAGKGERARGRGDEGTRGRGDAETRRRGDSQAITHHPKPTTCFP